MQRGKIVEQELFGTPDSRLLEQKEAKACERGRDGEYITFRTAMEIVRLCQGENDPTDPAPPFANDLHAAVAEVLTPKDYSRLRFYTAVDSDLDQRHGVDGFFDYQGEDDSRITVTVDVTTDPEKAHFRCRADVVLRVPAVGLDKETYGAVKYGNALNFYRDKIVAAIQERLPQKRREMYVR